MSENLITDQDRFEQFCSHVRQSGIVAFDTEFVSEYSYRPELCLLQFATAKRSVAVDPFAIRNLDSWWDLMTDEETTVVVHGGQAEIRFCLRAIDRRPRKLVDTQLAEGLHTRSYPIGHSALVRRILGKRVHGRETRTDWRRRPLTDRQIGYALDDAKHILPIWQRQRESLARQNRLAWAESEFSRLVEDVEAELSREPWQQLSGLHKLTPRELGVVREIIHWRENEAASRNRPARRMLRDDLVIELARRQPRSVKDLSDTRGMNRGDYKRAAPALIECVERGINLPEADLPQPPKNRAQDLNSDEHVLGQLLGIALASRCAAMNVAKVLVGTSADLRHLVRWHVYGERGGKKPRLTEGWRADVCGNLLTDVLDGKLALRVADPRSEQPLIFEKLDSDS